MFHASKIQPDFTRTREHQDQGLLCSLGCGCLLKQSLSLFKSFSPSGFLFISVSSFLSTFGYVKINTVSACIGRLCRHFPIVLTCIKLCLELMKTLT